MKTVTESIFDGLTTVIPMADVQHFTRHWINAKGSERTKQNYDGITVITRNTKWDFEMDYWSNQIYLPREEADTFIKAWAMYRHELEIETLVEFN